MDGPLPIQAGMMLHACATTIRYGSFSNPHNLGKEDYKILAYSISMINVGPKLILDSFLGPTSL